MLTTPDVGNVTQGQGVLDHQVFAHAVCNGCFSCQDQAVFCSGCVSYQGSAGLVGGVGGWFSATGVVYCGTPTLSSQGSPILGGGG